jgi:vacuolar iron transporter family protein
MAKTKPSLQAKLQKEHTKRKIHTRLNKLHQGTYIRDFVFGAVDGIVTTFAVVSGVKGAQLAYFIVIILGLANLIGDGISMAVSNFLATKTEKEELSKAKTEEEKHIKLVPEGEKEEIRQIYAKKGFKGKDLEKIVEVITANPELWVETMLQEELGLSTHFPNPLRAAVTTFVAFVVIGVLPLLPFIAAHFTAVFDPFYWSVLLAGIAFFIVGAFKSLFTAKKWYYSGLATLFLGGAAASASYLIGWLLKDLV